MELQNYSRIKIEGSWLDQMLSGVWQRTEHEQIDCFFCGTPIDCCAACGIDNLCDMPPCGDCVTDDMLVSPEELEWLEATGHSWRPLIPGDVEPRFRGVQQELFRVINSGNFITPP
jgi:hypothetical protein